MSSEWRLTAPALLAHVFFGRGDDMGDQARRLASAWDAVTDRFGLDDAIDGLGVPRRVPRGLPIAAEQTGLIAAAESGERSIWQACAWAGHGVLAVSVMMAPPRERDCRRQWADLERGWEQALAAGPGEGVLGRRLLQFTRVTDEVARALDASGTGPAAGNQASWLTARQAAMLLGLKPDSVRWLLRHGRLGGRRTECGWRVQEREVGVYRDGRADP